MEILDIADLSMGMSQAKAVTDVGTAVLAKSLDMMDAWGWNGGNDAAFHDGKLSYAKFGRKY